VKKEPTIKVYALANELTIGRIDPKEIRIPFGRWHYGQKRIEHPPGHAALADISQSFDRDGADSIAAQLARILKAGSPGIPVYFGHPDVPEVAVKYPDKRAKGWVNSATRREGELVLGVAWLESPGGGFGWFSPYWTGVVEFVNDINATVHVNELISIGLTNQPNIIDFRLENEAAENNNDGGDPGKKEPHTMDLTKLIQLLKLPAGATEQDVAAAITKLQTDCADCATQTEAAKAEAAEKEMELANSKKACANERAARIGLLLDNAIADGRITPSGRAAWEKRLAEDIGSGSIALANEHIKTESAVKGIGHRASDGKPGIIALVNEKMAKGVSYDDAYLAVKNEHAELFEPAEK
jgi:hypothetical protein